MEEVLALKLRPLPHPQGKFCLKKHAQGERGNVASKKTTPRERRSLLSHPQGEFCLKKHVQEERGSFASKKATPRKRRRHLKPFKHYPTSN